MTTLWASKPFLSVKSHGGVEFDQAEKPLENWLEYELHNNIKISSQLMMPLWN